MTRRIGRFFMVAFFLMISFGPVSAQQGTVSVTLKNGHVVTDVSQLSPGDTIVTRLGNGEVTSQVGNLQMDEHLQ